MPEVNPALVLAHSVCTAGKMVVHGSGVRGVARPRFCRTSGRSSDTRTGGRRETDKLQVASGMKSTPNDKFSWKKIVGKQSRLAKAGCERMRQRSQFQTNTTDKK